MPLLAAKMAKGQEYDRRLREEYGVYVNYVSPITWQGGKVWAIGSRLYTDRPPTETFHEFILHVLRGTLGEPWRAEQAALPDRDRHFILKCFERFSEFKKQNTDPEELAREGQVSAEMTGWVRYLLSLAWDVASLVHAGELPDALIRRLRDREQYQGARYEIAIAAIFARLNCAVESTVADGTKRSSPAGLLRYDTATTRRGALARRGWPSLW
jgi:hypothetical protein